MPAEYATNRMTPRQRRDLNRSKLLHDLAIPFLIVGMAASLTIVACNRGTYGNRHRRSQDQSSSRWHPPMRDPNSHQPRKPIDPRRGGNDSAQIYNGFTNSTTGPSGGLLR
jgi:hypothetical protein